MSLYATEVVRQWLDIGGTVEASELFPTLLSKSESEYEVEISTEDDATPGKYDGCEQDVPGEIQEQAELEAEQEFHGEALEAAKSFLQGVAPATSILRGDFDEREQKVLEEAAKLLGVEVPWDAAEAASIQAEEEARIRKLEAEKKVAAEYLETANAMIAAGGILPAFPTLTWELTYNLRQQLDNIVTGEMEKQLRAGKPRNEVAARFPGFGGQLGNVVGKLRAQGVLPPNVKREAA
jgi:hypothetical protein